MFALAKAILVKGWVDGIHLSTIVQFDQPLIRCGFDFRNDPLHLSQEDAIFGPFAYL
jgi:hypothetical protein